MTGSSEGAGTIRAAMTAICSVSQDPGRLVGYGEDYADILDILGKDDGETKVLYGHTPGTTPRHFGPTRRGLRQHPREGRPPQPFIGAQPFAVSGRPPHCRVPLSGASRTVLPEVVATCSKS